MNKNNRSIVAKWVPRGRGLKGMNILTPKGGDFGVNHGVCCRQRGGFGVNKAGPDLGSGRGGPLARHWGAAVGCWITPGH